MQTWTSDDSTDRTRRTEARRPARRSGTQLGRRAIARLGAIALLAAAFVVAERANATPILWDPAAGGNGHHYELVVFDGILPWTEARDLAAAMTFGGVAGHLATITSEAEQQFLNDQVLDTSIPVTWIGLERVGSSDDFAWITGEPLGFTNWFPGEPNNFDGNENFVGLQFISFFGGWGWNDLSLPNVGPTAFVVEFPTNVPEPSTAVLGVLGLAGLSAWSRRRRTSRMH